MAPAFAVCLAGFLSSLGFVLVAVLVGAGLAFGVGAVFSDGVLEPPSPTSRAMRSITPGDDWLAAAGWLVLLALPPDENRLPNRPLPPADAGSAAAVRVARTPGSVTLPGAASDAPRAATT